MHVVGISLVRNEDLFVRRALRNVAGFCDRLIVADHMSRDGTPEILRGLDEELAQLELHTIRHSADSHALIEDFAGTDTWILSVDGDELYDPDRLADLRAELERGTFDDVFRVRPAGLHCEELDEERALATGYLSPPSRPLVGLLNFAAIDGWTDVHDERLHGGNIAFRPGFAIERWRHLGAEQGWEESPFRVLHTCFLRRSTHDPEVLPAHGRPNLAETRAFRRGALGPALRFGRTLIGRNPAAAREASDWKGEKYRRGERVTVDASPFLAS